ncbi:beta-barrel assembly-enhancing protease [Neisseria sp. Ec49-e6-T10]|uniref:beta-barrel assembly-enhancing protease n=1 Tax=Neisseria sp. Ec49-e6-T10 TaxID=3140744 RepID=UPI003EBAE01E
MNKKLLPYLIVIGFSIGTTPLSVAQNLPSIGDSSQTVFSSQDEEQVGKQVYQELLRRGVVTDDIAVNTYLNELGLKLSQGIPNNQNTFTLFGVNDNSINAFAMPGGYIGVHRGLLINAQSESELASVLGHEMAHVTQRHLARMQEGSTMNSLLALAGVLAGALAASQGNVDAAGGLIQAGVGAAIAKQLSYSRDYEREADRIGMQYLANSGFDARAMPLFFSRLQSANRHNDNNSYAFLRTHPVTTERIGESQTLAQAYPVKLKADSTDFVLIREHLRVDALGTDKAVRYYPDSLRAKQYLNEGAQHYGFAKALYLQNKLSEATQQLNLAEQQLGNQPLFLDLAAKIALKNKSPTQAQNIYTQALRTYPNNKLLVYGQIETLLSLDKKIEARSLIQKQLQNNKNRPELYQLLATTYGEEEPLYSYAALGDAYYYQGLYQGALQQYEMALKANQEDFYLRSQIEAKITLIKNQTFKK